MGRIIRVPPLRPVSFPVTGSPAYGVESGLFRGAAGGGAPAGPITLETEASSTSGSSTNHTVTLPGSLVVGRILIVVVALRANTSISFPAGYTEFLSEGSNSVTDVAAGYRFVDGTEGASLTVTSGLGRAGAHWVGQYSGNHASAAPESVSGEGLDSPPITPTWGESDFFVIAGQGYEGVESPVAPAGYGTVTNQANDGALAVAGLLLEAQTSENPGAWSGMGLGRVVFALAIRPAA